MPPTSGFKIRAAAGFVILGLLVSIMAAIQLRVVRIYVVVSESMSPTLQVGDRVLIDSAGLPERFSVVALQDPTRREDPDEQLVKRIIGVGGDEIELRDGELFLNGEVQKSDHVTSDLINWPDVRVRVPIGHVFVLGDNRNESFDSLNFGTVSDRDITGLLKLILWPPRRWGPLEDFQDPAAQD